MGLAWFIVANVVIGYLFGSMSFSIIIGKKLYGKDPRDYESKNAGATNAMRLFGKSTGAIVLLFDMLKSIIPTLIIWGAAKGYVSDLSHDLGVAKNYIDPLVFTYLCPLFAIVGHCYPLFFNFKGGKGAACYAAFILMVSPIVAVICGCAFILITKKYKMVSLSVLLTAVFCPFLILIPGLNYYCLLAMYQTGFYSAISIYQATGPWASVMMIFVMVFVGLLVLIHKHKDNIQRIKNHNERKLGETKVATTTEEIIEEEKETLPEAASEVEVIKDEQPSEDKTETLEPDAVI